MYFKHQQQHLPLPQPSIAHQCGVEAVASRPTRGPIDNISFGAPLWPVTNHSVVFRILRVFRIR